MTLQATGRGEQGGAGDEDASDGEPADPRPKPFNIETDGEARRRSPEAEPGGGARTHYLSRPDRTAQAAASARPRT